MGKYNGERFTYGLEIPWDLYNFEDKERINRDIIINALNKTNNMFEYTNLPDTITPRILELMLQTMGAIVFTEVNGKYYVFRAALGGEPNEYYEPTIAIVNNPWLKYNAELEIGKECVLIRNDAMQAGLIPIIKKYATLITENEITMRITAINERIMSLIGAGTDESFKAAKKYIDDIVAGKLGAIADNAFIEAIKTQPYATAGTSNLNIALIELEQYLKASLLQEIGINANFNMKREALNSEESRLNDDALELLVNNMLECRRTAIEAINELYGLDISVDFAGPWKKRELINEVTEDETNDGSNLPVSGETETGEEEPAGESDSDDGDPEPGPEDSNPGDSSESAAGALDEIADALEEIADAITEEPESEVEKDEET